MQPPRPAAIAPSLLIGLLFGIYGAGALAAVFAGRHFEDGERWQMFSEACKMVQLAVLAYGAFALAARLFGATRHVMIAVGSLVAMLLVWEIAGPLLFFATASESETVWKWMAGGGAITGAVATVLLTIGTRAWRLAPVAAVFAILGALTSPWMPYMQSLIETAFLKPRLGAVYLFTREALWTGGMLWMLHAAARTTPVLADSRVVARGLRRAIVALVLHALAPVIAIVAALSMPASTELGLIYPVIVLATGLMCMWSLLEVERGRLAGVPRVLYALGVTAIVWSCVMTVVVALQQWEHAQWAERYAHLESYDEGRTVPWSILAPVIGLLGFVVVAISFTVHIARAPACAHLRASAGVTVSVVAACALFAIVMEVLSSTRDDMFALLIAGAIATIFCLLVLSRIIDGVACVVEDQPSLPVARLR